MNLLAIVKRLIERDGDREVKQDLLARQDAVIRRLRLEADIPRRPRPE